MTDKFFSLSGYPQKKNHIIFFFILRLQIIFQEGMGQLKIVAGGIQLSGQALVLDLLRASAIRSRHGQPIQIGMFFFYRQ